MCTKAHVTCKDILIAEVGLSLQVYGFGAQIQLVSLGSKCPNPSSGPSF